MHFEDVVNTIKPVNHDLEKEIRAHLDDLTKPQGSLGLLETFTLKYCLIQNTAKPVLGKKKIFTFAGDHGVVCEGVSAYPKEVTPQMVRTMLAGGAAVNVLARHAAIEVCVIDMGVDDPMENAPGLFQRKVMRGTHNIAQGPAMSLEQTIKAMEVGIELAKNAAQEKITLIGTGDMGIGNTTPSSALFAALLPCAVEDITGRGTGIDDAILLKKIKVIKKALDVNRHSLSTPLETLAALGGLEIAGICGLILGAASCRIPVVVDGFISSAGALLACNLCKDVKDYLFFSHRSNEKGHAAFFKLFGVEPILDLGMRLGEGTGAALAIPIIEASIKVYNEMATFSSAHVSGKD
jgi:nicotinate-nucleotide--dimethylbenzimidazole phosphoribosyltransferase